MTTNIVEETPRQYEIKFLYARTRHAIQKKVDKWIENMQSKSPHVYFEVIDTEPISFGFGSSGLWTYYGVAILYRSMII